MMQLIRDERGIAMTEGVIVMPFFIIIFMALIALHHIYEGRLEAQVNSLAKALEHAHLGCADDPGAVQENTEYRDGLDENGKKALDSAAGASPLQGAHTTGAETVVVDGVPTLFGGPTLTVSASQRVLCNMEPKDSIFGAIVEIIRDAVDW